MLLLYIGAQISYIVTLVVLLIEGNSAMDLRLAKLGIPAFALLLGACTTYETQTASNVTQETVATDEAAAEGAQAEGAVTETQAEAGEDRIICKRIIPTGTRFGRKECRSWREWREMREATQDILNEGQRRNLQVDTPRGG